MAGGAHKDSGHRFWFSVFYAFFAVLWLHEGATGWIRVAWIVVLVCGLVGAVVHGVRYVREWRAAEGVSDGRWD